MNQQQLLTSTVELGLHLLEKNGSFITFCTAIGAADEAPEPRIYLAESDTSFSSEEAYNSILFNVKRDIASGELKAVAFCFDSRVRFSHSEDKVPAIEVEIHYQGLPAVIYFFPYKIEGSKATVGEYHTNPAKESLFP